MCQVFAQAISKGKPICINKLTGSKNTLNKILNTAQHFEIILQCPEEETNLFLRKTVLSQQPCLGLCWRCIYDPFPWGLYLWLLM